MPSVRTAAAESPPPTTVSAVRQRSDRRRPPRGCPRRTAPARTRPSARSRTRCGLRRARSANAPTLCGPMSRPIQSAGMSSTATTSVAASALITPSRNDDIDRSAPPCRCRGSAGTCRSGRPRAATADFVALRGQEGEAHPTADEQPVDLRQQVLDDGQLVRDLRAAEDDDVGPARRLGELREHLELALPRGHRPRAGAASRRRTHLRDGDAPRRRRRRRRRRQPVASLAANSARSSPSFDVSAGSNLTFSSSTTSSLAAIGSCDLDEGHRHGRAARPSRVATGARL